MKLALAISALVAAITAQEASPSPVPAPVLPTVASFWFKTRDSGSEYGEVDIAAGTSTGVVNVALDKPTLVHIGKWPEDGSCSLSITCNDGQALTVSGSGGNMDLDACGGDLLIANYEAHCQ